jgi:hypothetical protein
MYFLNPAHADSFTASLQLPYNDLCEHRITRDGGECIMYDITVCWITFPAALSAAPVTLRDLSIPDLHWLSKKLDLAWTGL